MRQSFFRRKEYCLCRRTNQAPRRDWLSEQSCCTADTHSPDLWKAGFPLQTVMHICCFQRTACGPQASVLCGFLLTTFHRPWAKASDGNWG